MSGLLKWGSAGSVRTNKKNQSNCLDPSTQQDTMCNGLKTQYMRNSTIVCPVEIIWPLGIQTVQAIKKLTFACFEHYL